MAMISGNYPTAGSEGAFDRGAAAPRPGPASATSYPAHPSRDLTAVATRFGFYHKNQEPGELVSPTEQREWMRRMESKVDRIETKALPPSPRRS